MRKFFDRGVAVTINSDDSAAFGTNIADEFSIAENIFSFAPGEIEQLLKYAVNGSFLPAQERAALERRLVDSRQ